MYRRACPLASRLPPLRQRSPGKQYESITMSSPTRPRHTLRWLTLAIIFILATGGGYWWTHQPQPSRFVTAEVTRGAIVRSVTATGTVNPVTTVQVGTYVS